MATHNIDTKKAAILKFGLRGFPIRFAILLKMRSMAKRIIKEKKTETSLVFFELSV